jgi:Rho GTPase-activating protein 1
MEEEGLFRRSPNSVLLRQVQEAYDRGHVVNLHTYNDPHLAAVLIKKYFRDLPAPIFPESMYAAIRKCPMPAEADVRAVTYIRETLLPMLPHCAYVLLSFVLRECHVWGDNEARADAAEDLMHEVSLRAGQNQMDATNLTIVLGPNLVKSSSPLRDVQMAGFSASEPTLGTVLRTCITRYYECFEDVPDRAEAVADVVDADVDGGSLASSATFSLGDEEEDEIDDAMLVMPLGPALPTAVSAPAMPAATPAPYQVRKRKSMPGSRTSTLARSTLAPSESMRGTGTVRTRSLVSVEGTVGRAGAGSIVLGRGGTGTVRGKAAGAGVSAVGVTASGFFTAPDAPPVPTLPP